MDNPEQYLRANHYQRRDSAEIVVDFKEKMNWQQNDGETLLDIGCGSGDVTADIVLPLLSSNFGKIVGADISQEMINFSKSTLESKHPRLQFKVMDIGDEDLEISERYDHVTSFYCLHWVQNQRQAVRNIYNLLKPGGDILLMFIVHSVLYDIFIIMASDSKWAPYMKNLSTIISPYQHSAEPSDEFKEHLQVAQFTNIHCEERNKSFVFESFCDFRDFLKSVNPFAKATPDDLKDDFYVDYFQLMKDKDMVKEDGDILEAVIPYTLLSATATKD